MRHDIRKRLADSIETAVGLADGLVEIEIVGSSRADIDGGGAGVRDAGRPIAFLRRIGDKGGESPQIVPGEKPEPGTLFTFSEKFACPEHGPSLVELEPRIFSFNSPHGACERCTGLGSQMVIDPELVVPDPSLSVGEGAIAPWANSASNYYEQVTEAIAKRYKRRSECPLGGAFTRASRPVPVGYERGSPPNHLPEPLRAHPLIWHALRGRSGKPAAALSRDRLRVDSREDRGVHVLARLSGVRRRTLAPGVQGGPGGGHEDRGFLRALGAQGFGLARAGRAV